MVGGDVWMDDSMMRLHHFLPHSRANGSGIRAVLWVQGCSLACPGCFNRGCTVNCVTGYLSCPPPEGQMTSVNAKQEAR